MKLILLAVLVLVVWFSCAGCAITGTLQTPYGSLSSDDKTVHVVAKAGYVK